MPPGPPAPQRPQGSAPFDAQLPVTPPLTLPVHLTALLLAVLSGLTLLAAPPASRAEEPIQAHYMCKGLLDAAEVRALFFNQAPGEVVLLTGSEGATRLLQQRSADGARYAEGNESFWVKGDRAIWQRGTSKTLQCDPAPKR